MSEGKRSKVTVVLAALGGAAAGGYVAQEFHDMVIEGGQENIFLQAHYDENASGERLTALKEASKENYDSVLKNQIADDMQSEACAWGAFVGVPTAIMAYLLVRKIGDFVQNFTAPRNKPHQTRLNLG